MYPSYQPLDQLNLVSSQSLRRLLTVLMVVHDATNVFGRGNNYITVSKDMILIFFTLEGLYVHF